MTAIPTELLDLVKKYSTYIRSVTAVTAVYSILAMYIAIASAAPVNGHPVAYIFFGIFIFLLVCLLYWMFVRPCRAQYASEPATLWNILLPVMVFVLLGIISIIYINTALKYLNASPDYFMLVQPSGWGAT